MSFAETGSQAVLAAAVCGRALLAGGDTAALVAVIAGERILAFAHLEGFDPFTPPRCAAVAAGTVARRPRSAIPKSPPISACATC